MAVVRLAQASHDERGTYHGGAAGDQTGDELNIRTWYNRPWDTVLRAKDKNFGILLAQIAQILVKCVLIGYDQYERTTLYDQCELIGWNINRINEIKPCECDCSSMIAVLMRFAGISISKYTNTSTLTNALQQTGKFEVLRDPKYLTSGNYLRKGDLVLNTWHHVAVCLDNGDNALEPFAPYIAVVNVKTHLKVRTGPSTSFPEFMIDGGDGTWTPWRLPPSAQVVIMEESNGWGRIGDTIGWASLSFLRR